jgi:inner membrane protein
MPTLLSHAAVPLAVGLGLGSRTVPPQLLLAGVVASMLPDLDVVGFRLGIPYTDIFGHRGFSHSFLSALLIGLAAAGVAGRLRCTRTAALLVVAASMASHGLLDIFTDGGPGVALLWPWSETRFFAPWRVIEASPLRIARLLSARGGEVISSEVLWVWLPAAAAALLTMLVRRSRSRVPGVALPGEHRHIHETHPPASDA